MRSHGNHHIRVYMHHVCLIQSVSARKAIHIKLGTARVALNASYALVIKWC